MEVGSTRLDLERRIQFLEQKLDEARQESRHVSEELFKKMYLSSGVGIARVGLDFTILQANVAYCRMLGYTEEELQGKTLAEITAPEDVHENLDKQSQLGNLEIDSFRMEKRFVRKDGSMAWGLLSANLIVDQDGRPQFFLGSVVDISERKAAEAALQENESKYRTLFENMEQGAFFQMADGSLGDVNPRALELLGLTREKFVGRNVPLSGWSFLQEDGSPLLEEDYPSLKAIRTGKPVRNVVVGINSPTIDRTHWLSVSAVPQFRDEEKTPYQSFVTLHDLTQAKRMEKHMALAHKLEAIGTLSGGIAHDFNNIMSIILGNAELGLADLPEDNPVHDNLHEIHSAALRARDVVRQLMSFSSNVPVKRQNIDIIPVIQESMRLMRATTPASVVIDVKILVEQAMVYADSAQIYQMMINLCTNASNAMAGEGGAMTVQVQRTTVEQEGPSPSQPDVGEYVQVSVSDTGVGMDAHTVGRAFDPYFTTREVGKGSGMGLAIVHGIVKSHGGHVSLSSSPGKGSTFSVFFPLQMVEEARERAHVDLSGKGEQLLLVDDEVSLLKATRLILGRLGYKVVDCLDGRKALEVFQEDPDRFDCIITDMSMPHMSGDVLARKILEIRPEIPIVLCTGFSEKIGEQTAQAQGIAAFLTKPVSRRNLAETLRNIFEDKERRSI